MEGKVIKPFYHSHPLVLKEKVVSGEERVESCYGCRKPVADSEMVYVCMEADYGDSCRNCKDMILHKKCGELPSEIDQHPKHPHHPIHLFDYHNRNHRCDVCRRALEHVLGYRCDSCDVDIDITCEKVGIDAFLEERRKELHHPSHPSHPLTLIRKAPFLFYCDGCGAEGADMAYICSTCEVMLHKSCASLPVDVPTDQHHHRLSLAFSFPEKHLKFNYKCEVCDKLLDRTCWVYYCDDCRYFVHIKCVVAVGSSTSKFPDSSDFERLDKLESDQAEMKGQLVSANTQLKQITATLAELSRAIMKMSDGKTEGGASSNVGEDSEEPRVPPSRKLLSLQLQLPTFNGSDPIGWLARANQQFEIHGTSAGQKLALAVVAMEESALYWVTWLRSRNPGLTWEEFSQAIVARFDTRFKGGPFERLADVKQSGSVEEYVKVFVQLASQVPGFSDEHYLGYFMMGLADSIRSAVRLLRPGDLETAMELAMYVEDNLALQFGGRASSGEVSALIHANSYSRPIFGANSGSGKTPGNSDGSAPGQNANQPRFTRLSPNEYADLRAKGLCYRCKKPYTPGHECSLKQLRVLLAEEDELLDFSGAKFVGPFNSGDPNEELG